MPRIPRRASLFATAAVVAVAAAGCGGGSDNGASEQELTGLRQDAKYWRQLTSLMQPVKLSSMSDHRAYMLPSGVVVALHFDKLDLGKAKNLNWVALGFPGRFCKADQERIERQFGNGFTHFHDLKNNQHGGKPGAEGLWLVHVGVRNFEAPWGQVSRQIDQRFMPTKAPACS